MITTFDHLLVVSSQRMICMLFNRSSGETPASLELLVNSYDALQFLDDTRRITFWTGRSPLIRQLIFCMLDFIRTIDKQVIELPTNSCPRKS